MVTEQHMAHLVRRAGFGATGAEVEAATTAGFAGTIDRLITGLQGPDLPSAPSGGAWYWSPSTGATTG